MAGESTISTWWQRLAALLSYNGSSSSVLPFIPKPLRIAFVVLLLVNYRSLPLVWHFRLFRPILYLRFQWWITLMPLRSKKSQQAWLDALSPVSIHPFELQAGYKTWASIDECDFNIHLSNSSYAKTMDFARMQAAVDYFYGFLRDGGWIALAATHYQFVREVPVLATYEVRLTILAWDQKWMFLGVKYVTRSKRKAIKLQDEDNKDSASRFASGPLPLPSIHTPATEESLPSSSGTSTPNPSSTTPLLSSLVGTTEPDGATVHCVALSQCCFKIGRITVPPALAFGVSGFLVGRDSEEWKSVCAMRSSKPKGPGKGQEGDEMRAFLRGGWKDVEPQDRWWEKSLGGEIEARRARNWEVAKRIKEGIEGLRAL